MRKIWRRSSNALRNPGSTSKAWSVPSASVEKYNVLITTSAARELEAVDNKRARNRIVAAIRALSGAPRRPGIEKLSGQASRFRVRVGDFRVVYEVDDENRSVDVVKIAHADSKPA